MLVTVAICTWNRAELLDQTLDEMRRLEIPESVTWELLIVNNNCTDETDAVIEKHQAALPIRRLLETKQGLSNARNCAVAAAAGSLLLWTDDDVLVNPRWLKAYVEAAAAWPDAVFFGGAVEPWFVTDAPDWVKRNLKMCGPVFALKDVDDGVRPIKPENTPIGANMAFRTDVLKRLSFDAALGRNGKWLGSAEEKEMLDNLMASGYQGMWVGGARVRHYVPPERLKTDYAWHWKRSEGQSYVRRNKEFALQLSASPKFWGAPRWVVRQHLLARARACVLSPYKGTSWFRAFAEAAFLRGIIEECRHSARNSGAQANQQRASGQTTISK